MLKKPRVTICPLPLYFYIPNFGGIVLSAKQLRILQSLCDGLKASYLLYKEKADDYQMQQWSEKFKWFFIKWAFRKVKYLDNNEDIEIAVKRFCELEQIGAFDNPTTKWAKKLRCNIRKFIKGKCKKNV